MRRPPSLLTRLCSLAAGLLLLSTAASAQSVEFLDLVSAAPEDGSSALVRVALGTPQAQDTTVTYALSGRAVPGVDVIDLGSGSLVIPAGALEASIELQLVEDGLYERDETLEIRLLATSSGTLGAAVRHVLTVIEDGPAPLVSFVLPTLTLAEGSGVHDLPLVLSGPSVVPLTVQVELSGAVTPGELELLGGGLVVFAPGQLQATLRLQAGDDGLDEPEERAVLRLVPLAPLATGALSRSVVKLVDDDPAPAISISASASQAPESGEPVELTVALSAPSGREVRASLLPGGSAGYGVDWTLSATEVVLAPGSTQATVQCVPLDDSLFEGSEDATVTLRTRERHAGGAALGRGHACGRRPPADPRLRNCILRAGRGRRSRRRSRAPRCPLWARHDGRPVE